MVELSRALGAGWACAALLVACGGGTRPSGTSTIVSGAPTAIDDGWTLSSAGAEGLDAAGMAALSGAIASGQYGQVDGLVIARNGRLCFDGYYNGTPYDVHEMQSVTKSVTSALIGVAVARGAIAGVQQPVAAVLPAFAAAALSDPAKGRIRVEDLLTMSAGLDWDETTIPNGDPRNTLTQMNASPDWDAFVLSRGAIDLPGLRFNYNSGGVILLGAILRAATGQDAAAFAADALFAPMGIRDARWSRNPARPEQVHTGGGLSLRARDAAKFGQMYLDEGVWAGQRLLPADWIRESTRPRIGAWDGAQYGYLWWLRIATGGHSIAEGWGTRGQHVFVVAPLRMVVVVTARDNRIDAGRQILDFVIGAAATR
jgi:CubicO group peptidase (beta-lactamase class C family)